MQINLTRTNQIQAMNSQNKPQIEQNPAFGAILLHDLAKLDAYHTVLKPQLKEQAIIGKAAQLIREINKQDKKNPSQTIANKVMHLFSKVFKDNGFEHEIILSPSGLKIVPPKGKKILPAADITVFNHTFTKYNEGGNFEDLTTYPITHNEIYKGANISFPETNENLHDLLLSNETLKNKLIYKRVDEDVPHIILSGEREYGKTRQTSGGKWVLFDDFRLEIPANSKEAHKIEDLAISQFHLNKIANEAIDNLKDYSKSLQANKPERQNIKSQAIDSKDPGDAIKKFANMVAK